MGDQLFTIVYKQRVVKLTKGGKEREVWERHYRSPQAEDDNSATIDAYLALKMPEWEAAGIVPMEPIGEISNYDRGPRID